MLSDYFNARRETFPSGTGSYATKFPSRGDFEPPAGVFLVVEGENLAGEPADVGCGGIRRIAPGRYEVKHLWLNPSTRGRGFGHLLLDELERRALLFGARELVLDTNDSLLAAGALYKAHGYLEIEPYNDNPNANLWLRKVLTEPRRMIQMFPDYPVGPLWERTHPNYQMEPENYDLPHDLAEGLREWNDRWSKVLSVREVGPSRDRWITDGQKLADQLRDIVGEFADVEYTP